MQNLLAKVFKIQKLLCKFFAAGFFFARNGEKFQKYLKIFFFIFFIFYIFIIFFFLKIQIFFFFFLWDFFIDIY